MHLEKINRHQEIILNTLIKFRGDPLSTREIAKKTGINWELTSRCLQILYGKRKTVHKIERKNITLWYFSYKYHDRDFYHN